MPPYASGGTNTLVFRNSADAGWLAGENDHHFWRNWQRLLKGSASFIHIEGAFEMVAANCELGPSDRLIVPLADMPPRGGNCSARWELPLLWPIGTPRDESTMT